MKKILILLFVFYSFAVTAFQSGSEKMKVIDGKNYLVYKVQNGDGWYSIARKFDITYAELRVANKNTDDKLFPGKELLIPSKLKANDPYFEKNHIEQTKQEPTRSHENKYHLVAPGQTLFSISNMYSITVEQLKTWNNLTSNSISKGQKLIVGKAEILETPMQETNVPVKKEEVKKEEIKKEEVKKEEVIVPAVVDVKPKPSVETTDFNVEVDSIQPSSIISSPSAVSNESEEKKENNTPAAIEKNEPVSNPDDKVVFSNGRKEINETGTAIRMDDEDQNQDKYYALHKTAPIGTIIRVTNPANSNKIYVKVTGKLVDSADNNNVIIKLSKASVEKLGVSEKSFQVNLLFGITPE